MPRKSGNRFSEKTDCRDKPGVDAESRHQSGFDPRLPRQCLDVHDRHASIDMIVFATPSGRMPAGSNRGM